MRKKQGGKITIKIKAEKKYLIFFALILIGVGVSMITEVLAAAPTGGMLATAYLAVKGKKPFVCAEKNKFQR